MAHFLAKTIGLSVSKNNVEFTTPIFRSLGDPGDYSHHLEWNFPGGIGTFDGFMGLRIYTTQDVDFATDLLIANFR